MNALESAFPGRFVANCESRDKKCSWQNFQVDCLGSYRLEGTISLRGPDKTEPNFRLEKEQ